MDRRADTYTPYAHLPARVLRHGSAVASANERRILREIWFQPGISRAELAERSDLTQQSIHRLVDRLAGDGLVTLGDAVPPRTSGKPSPALWLARRFAATIGASLDTDRLSVSVMDFSGRHRSQTVQLSGEPELDETLARIRRISGALLGQMGAQAEHVLGLGFAISGFRVDADRFNPPLPLRHWADLPLAAEIGARLGLATWAENGANTGALSEALFGAGRGVANFAYLSFNHGFGAGLVADGQLISGGHGNAGELSGMFTAAEMADRPALRSLVEMHAAQGKRVHSVSDLADPRKRDAEICAAWVDRVAPLHTRMLNVLAATVDPEIIVYGGQIPPPLAEALIARASFYGAPRHGVNRAMPRLQVSELGPECLALGAALMPLRATLI